MNTDLNNLTDAYYIKFPSDRFHSSMKPYLGFSTLEADDSAFHLTNYKIKNHFLEKTFHAEPKFRNKISTQILPITDVQAGYDALLGKAISEITGGIYSKININQDFSADLTFIGGQVSYPEFTDTLVKQYKVIPGLGMAYGSAGNYQFTNLTGHVSYSPGRIFNFQLGKDKMFIGDGYRSLLLSDVANNYPYFKSTVNIWKLQYSVWYSWFRDIYNANGMQQKFLNRYGTFHYLSYNISPQLNIGLFETVIFEGANANRHRGFDPNYLNPVIFYRPIEYSIGSPDNELLGFNFSWKFLQQYKIYGQVILDEFNFQQMKLREGWWGDKQGFQIGFKHLDLFGIKNLTLQSEFNWIRPFTYSHGNEQQNYSQFNQPLAHPFGANFYEIPTFLTYRFKRSQIDLKCIYAVIGKDSSNLHGDIGQNIFLSYNLRSFEYGNNVTQGIQNNFFQGELKFTWFVLPGINMRIETGIIQRFMSNTQGYLREDPYIYLGIKTSMYNFYRDF